MPRLMRPSTHPSMRTARRAVATLLARQLAVPPFLLVADVETQANAAPPNATHVEDHTTKQCRAPHDASCLVCRRLSVASAVPPAEAPVVAISGRIDVHRARVIGAVRRAARGEPSSRAPPSRT